MKSLPNVREAFLWTKLVLYLSFSQKDYILLTLPLPAFELEIFLAAPV